MAKLLIDKLVYAARIAAPILTVPQVLKIWIGKSAAGVSALTWGTYTITAVIWLAYGIAHKNKPIIISYGLWIVLELLIVIGTILYG